ncbi:MAG: NAD-dependent epimerase/dehydratase family protein [Clostridia bacterium]|nr:NAD-dependent epimerase/dehydratase family protein [Clostridia bacterium]
MSEKLSVVTGAKGYLGHTLVEELTKRGEKVRISLHSECHDFDDYDCEIIYGSVTDLDHLMEICKGADTVYHVAGVVDITGTKDKLVMDVNYEGTKKMVEACKACGVKTLVYVSSVDCVAVDNGDSLIYEPEFFDPEPIEGAYGKSKALATQYVNEANCKELKTVSVHPSCCIGPNDIYGTNSVCTMINLYNMGLFPVTLNFGGYNFVDVRDVSKGMIDAGEKGKGGESYFLCGDRLTVNEFIATLAKINGKKPPKIALGKDLLLKLCPLIDKIFEAAKLPRVLTPFSINKICENCNFSYEKAAKDFGYSPMSAEDSLRDTVNWLKENSDNPLPFDLEKVKKAVAAFAAAAGAAVVGKKLFKRK